MLTYAHVCDRLRFVYIGLKREREREREREKDEVSGIYYISM
jgi:hypothetical protein